MKLTPTSRIYGELPQTSDRKEEVPAKLACSCTCHGSGAAAIARLAALKTNEETTACRNPAMNLHQATSSLPSVATSRGREEKHVITCENKTIVRYKAR